MLADMIEGISIMHCVEIFARDVFGVKPKFWYLSAWLLMKNPMIPMFERSKTYITIAES